MAKKDAEGEKRFAPFWRVYLSSKEGKTAQVAELRKYVHAVEVSEARPPGETGASKKK
jgi:hypothetical protein